MQMKCVFPNNSLLNLMKWNKQWYRICLSTELQLTAKLCIHLSYVLTEQHLGAGMNGCQHFALRSIWLDFNSSEDLFSTLEPMKLNKAQWFCFGEQWRERLSGGQQDLLCGIALLWTEWLVELPVAGLQWHCGLKPALQCAGEADSSVTSLV